MNCKEFIAAISGKEVEFTRTDLATGECRERAVITPLNAYETARGAVGVTLLNGTHCYGGMDLFTAEHGIVVAVVLTGAGHLFCDRFVPVNS